MAKAVTLHVSRARGSIMRTGDSRLLFTALVTPASFSGTSSAMAETSVNPSRPTQLAQRQIECDPLIAAIRARSKSKKLAGAATSLASDPFRQNVLTRPRPNSDIRQIQNSWP
jgi:hypothetical protein